VTAHSGASRSPSPVRPGAPDRARGLVLTYAEAKSRQDVPAALALCHPSFTIETIPFRIESRDRDETAAHLSLFFSVFPDYAAETQGLARDGGQLAWWGRVRMTFGGDLPGIEATGRTATLPAFSVFDVCDDRLARERFFFDLAMLCDGIGVRVETWSAALAAIRAVD